MLQLKYSARDTERVGELAAGYGRQVNLSRP